MHISLEQNTQGSLLKSDKELSTKGAMMGKEILKQFYIQPILSSLYSLMPA